MTGLVQIGAPKAVCNPFLLHVLNAQYCLYFVGRILHSKEINIHLKLLLMPFYITLHFTLLL